MSASDDRRQAANEGKDVTPYMSDDKRKVTRIEITEKGPREVEYPIVDLAELRGAAVKVQVTEDKAASK